MISELKNVLLAGLGTAAYTYEKAGKFIDEMVQKGRLTIEEGKELSEELKRNVKTKAEEIKPITKDDMNEILKEMNFATKDDITKINERLATLEAKNQ